MPGFDPFSGPQLLAAFPSTRAQLELWVAAQLSEDASRAYNEGVALQLFGKLETDVLRLAIEGLLQRHEALRGVFSPDGGTMFVTAPSPPAIEWHDLSALSNTEQSLAVEQLHRDAASRIFDLVAGPLTRFSLVRRSADWHELLIVAHHLVCDGWSFGVLSSELGRLYDALASSADLPTAVASLGTPARFSDYATTLRAREGDPERNRALRYWLTEFATIPEAIELPADRPRPVHQTFTAAREDRELPASLLAELKSFSAKQNVSLFTTVFGAFSLLLSRLAGAEELVVCVPAAGQLAEQQHGMVGHCVNTIPIRLPVDLEQSVAAYLARVRVKVLDGLEHQQVGFGEIVEQLAMPRDPSRRPLASIVFNLDRALSASAQSFGGMRVRMESVPRIAEMFDLFLNVTERDDGLGLECQYSTDLFDAETIRSWLERVEILLRSAIATPDAIIGRLMLRTDDDQLVLARCNETQRDWTSDVLAHALVEARAAHAPKAIAVEYDGLSLRYETLNTRANQLARRLRAAGVRRGVLVGLYVTRSPGLLVSLLAILKAGGAYVPLDPALPTERLARMVADAKLALIVADAALREDAEHLAATIVVHDALYDDALVHDNSDHADPDASSSNGGNLGRDAHSSLAGDPAYVIFTSGSTGRPKGVVVTQGSLVNLLRSVQETPGMTADDVVLAVTTLSFDIAVSELLLPLTVGARIVLASRDTASDGALLRTLVESRGVTFIDATPATYRLLLAEGWNGGPQLTLICTGEAMPRELALALVPRARAVWNGYGPTETTVWSTFHRIQDAAAPVLIGHPIANTRIDIRDAFSETVPTGVIGELFIGGAGVAHGYLGNPALTAERFRDDPVVTGLRWYRTGDLVRLLRSGQLECLGRADDQVKIRGYRIEPGEISAIASQWPGVQQCVVMARADDTRDMRLVAYVVADAGTEFNEAFRAFLRQALPDYMLPAAVVVLDAMPLTASGKVDRKRLPAPDTSASTATLEFQAPSTTTERLLADLWQSALGIGRVGTQDDFFALGGHSLLASQVLARLRRDHGIELTFRRIFESPTIAALAAHIDASAVNGTSVAVRPAVIARASSTSAPLTAQQERLWMLEELDPATRPTHSHPASWQLTGALNVPALEDALTQFIRRHAILRTSFHLQDGVREQKVHDEVDFALARLDLALFDPDAQEAALQAYYAAQESTPFDLQQAPLFRATLITLGPDQHRLYTLQHGMVWDGWSFDLFVRDLAECYQAACEQRSPTLPALSITFGDYAAWQHEWLSSARAEEQRRWWDSRLADAVDPVELRVDRPRTNASSYLGGQRSIAFSAAEAESLSHFAQRYESTLFMVVFSAFAALLHRYTGQRDLLVASPMRSRTQVELEDLLGPFVNAIVLRTAVAPDMSFTALLRAVRELALDSYAHQELPFESLGGRLPAIRAIFSMQDARTRPQAFGALSISQVHVPLHYATNDITLWVMQLPDRLSATLNFSVDVFDDVTADVFLAQLQALLREVQALPEGSIGALSLQTTFEPDHANLSSTLTASDAAREATLDAIARHASERPDAIAVQDGRAHVSYDELWRRVSQLSDALTARGISSADRVAVELPSGAARVTASLAVLRAGGAVLPLSRDDSASYRSLLLSAATPLLHIAHVPGDSAIPRVDLHSLEREGGSAPAVPAEQRGVGALLLAEPTVDGAVRLTTHAMPRLGTQAAEISRALGLSGDAVLLCAVPTSAPTWCATVLSALASGAQLRVVDDESLGDARDLSEDARGCTHLAAVTESWRATRDPAWSGPAFVASLVMGGDPLSAAMQDAARGAPLFVTNGASRDASLSWLFRVVPRDVPRDTLVAGRVGSRIPATAFLPETLIRTVDSSERVVPVGVPGRLDVCAADARGEWMPSVEQARRLPSGDVQLLEPLDTVACVYGQNVSLVLLESMVRRHSGVFDAACVVHLDRSGASWVVAHVVPVPGSVLDLAAMRSDLQARVPLSWVPARFVAEAHVSRTPGGALQRSQLRSPFADRDGDRAASEPTSNEERLVREVWKELLGLSHVDRQHNFFQVGGTSLLAFRAIDMLHARSGVRVSPRTLLTGTLADAAVEIAARLRASSR